MSTSDYSTTLGGARIERHQFFDGQRLLAADLQGLEAFHREMRELHNRSLHQPGIGNGFAVGGGRGDRQVTIGPGYALDVAGHEIVLTEARIEPVPPVAAGDDGGPAFFHLTVSYPSDDDLEEAETRQGLCRTHGTVRRREEPVFCWVRLTLDGTGQLRPADRRLGLDILEGRKIVLARVEVRDCRLDKEPFVAQRRNARPALGPRIVCGRTRPAWQISSEIDGTVFFLRGEVDTRQAGFLTAPCYTARIDGPRLLSAPGINGGTQFFADGLVRIEDERPDGFVTSVRLVVSPDGILSAIPDPLTPFLGWEVEWMGIE